MRSLEFYTFPKPFSLTIIDKVQYCMIFPEPYKIFLEEPKLGNTSINYNRPTSSSYIASIGIDV
jgi:hypothetical protein